MRLALPPRLAAGFMGDVRGTSAVEFGIIGLAFFLLMFGAIEGGRMLWTQNQLQYAVEQAARCAVVSTSTCGTNAQTESYAAGMVYGQTISNSVFSVTSASCGTQVSASLAYKAIVIPISVTLAASSCRPT